jgi:acetyl esterase/lipase
MKKLITLLTLLVALSGCNKADITVVPTETPLSLKVASITYEEKRDNSYGSSASQQYDLYLPTTRNTRNPVIVLLHGGAWRVGDKENMNFIVNDLKAKGVNCAVVNINYRLVVAGSGVNFQQQIEDIDKALKQVASQSVGLGISSKFYLIGMSSGAHLAMMYAQTADQNHLVAGIGAVAPPFDLTTQKIREGVIGADITQFIGKSYAEAPQAYKQASPMYNYNNPSVPTIVFYGGKDGIVTPDQSEAAKSVILGASATNEFRFYPNETHEWSVWSETVNLMIDFAERNL